MRNALRDVETGLTVYARALEGALSGDQVNLFLGLDGGWEQEPAH